jgi:hypothetical protein
VIRPDGGPLKEHVEVDEAYIGVPEARRVAVVGHLVADLGMLELRDAGAPPSPGRTIPPAV